MKYLQVLEDGVDVGNLEDVLLALLGGVGDLAVVDDETIAVSATLVIGPADTLGELGLGIGEEEEVVSGNTVGLAPGAHDVGVVVGENSNDIDTLGLELRELLGVLGNVSGGADGGESTGKREEDDLLVGPLLGGVVVDGDTTGSDVALLLRPGDVGEDNVSGEAVTSLETRTRHFD